MYTNSCLKCRYLISHYFGGYSDDKFSKFHSHMHDPGHLLPHKKECHFYKHLSATPLLSFHPQFQTLEFVTQNDVFSVH